MNDQPERDTLEDILDAFVASETDPNRALAEWIRRYPRYERELIEFAASWSLMIGLPPSPDEGDTEPAVYRATGFAARPSRVDAVFEQNALVRAGMGVLHRLRYSAGRSRTPPATGLPIFSLIAEGRDRGLTPSQLARAADLSEILLRKLDRHLISYPSIPQAAIEALAAAIQREVASVDRYLQSESGTTVAAEWAGLEHRLAEPEDFFAAVRRDPTMTADQKARWLAHEPRQR